MRQPSLPNPQGRCGSCRRIRRTCILTATNNGDDSMLLGRSLPRPCSLSMIATTKIAGGRGLVFSAMVLKIRPLMSSVLAPCSSRSLAILTLYGGAISTTHLDHVLVVLNDFTEQHDVFFYLMVMHVSSTRPKPKLHCYAATQFHMIKGRGKVGVSHDSGDKKKGMC